MIAGGRRTLEHDRQRRNTLRAIQATRSALPIAGTPGEAFLRTLDLTQPTRFGFVPLLRHFSEFDKGSFPAVVAPFKRRAEGADGSKFWTQTAAFAAWFHIDGVAPMFSEIRKAGADVQVRRADDVFEFPELNIGQVTGSVCALEILDRTDETLILSSYLSPALPVRRHTGGRIWLTGDANNFEAPRVPAHIRNVWLVGASVEAAEAFRKRHADREDLEIHEQRAADPVRV